MSSPAPRPRTTSSSGDGLEHARPARRPASGRGRRGTSGGSPRTGRRRRARSPSAGRRAGRRRPRPPRPTTRARRRSAIRGRSPARASSAVWAMTTGIAEDDRPDDDPPEDHPRSRQRFAHGDRLPDEMATEDRGGHRPALDRGDQRGRSPARNPSRPYQIPKPERSSWVISRSVRWTLTTSKAKLASANGTDGPEHDQTDVERRPAHVVGRSRQQVEAGAQQAAGGLDGRGRELGLERQPWRLRIGSGLSPSRLGIGFRGSGTGGS